MKSTALDRKDKSLTTLNDLVVVVRNTIHELLQISMYDTKLEDDERIRERREQLRKSIKACPIGDTRAKAFIKEYILDILQTKLRLTEEDIEKFITFGDVNRLSMQDKFDIVLYSYRIEYGTEALEKII